MKLKTIVTAGAVAAMLVGCSNGNSSTTDIKHLNLVLSVH